MNKILHAFSRCLRRPIGNHRTWAAARGNKALVDQGGRERVRSGTGLAMESGVGEDRSRHFGQQALSTLVVGFRIAQDFRHFRLGTLRSPGL